MIKTAKNNGRIILYKDIPEDFKAVSSWFSPSLPNAIKDASKIANGKANGTNVGIMYTTISNMIGHSSPFPIRSSIYFHTFCIRSIKSIVKNEPINGLVNAFNTSLSRVFSIIKITDNQR